MRSAMANQNPAKRAVLSIQSFVLVLCSLFWAAPQAHSGVRVALVLDKGGKDDKSFNEASFSGATLAQKEFGIELKTVETADDNAFEPTLRAFARKKFDLILAIGFAQAEAVKKVAADFPEQKFAIIDAQVDSPNVRSLLFEEHEGSYLVGAIAALKSKTGKIGFVGGMDIPLIRRFQLAYEAGAKAVRPSTRVESSYVGVTGSAWKNPPKGKELALTQYNGGVDVIFAAAGASGLGVFDASEEKKKFAIGVDSNQNWIKPGLILTSMLKRVDLAVHAACKDVVAGKFSGGTQRFGLANEGVDFAIDEHNRALLTPEILSQVRALKKKIIARQIQVPDYYLQQRKK